MKQGEIVITERTLRRYTNLASALHILHNSCLTLLSPETWDDRNDTYFMSEYKRLKKLKTVLAICIADREETYHHWQVFSRGADGVCIEFDRDKLLAAFDSVAGVTHRHVDYGLLNNISNIRNANIEILPFTKRWPYGDEQEYRAVFVSASEDLQTYPIPIALTVIKRITLSPWLAPALVAPLQKTLNSLPGCSRLQIYRSTLIDNEQWQKLVRRVAPPPSVPST